jgi:hypothetical protein
MAEGPSRLHVIRDTSLWVGGLLGIGYQTLAHDVNPILTGVFMAMLGLPGIGGLVSAVRNTTDSPSPSPPPSSSQPSSSQAQEP